jgi:hypothetical protein
MDVGWRGGAKPNIHLVNMLCRVRMAEAKVREV